MEKTWTKMTLSGWIILSGMMTIILFVGLKIQNLVSPVNESCR